MVEEGGEECIEYTVYPVNKGIDAFIGRLPIVDRHWRKDQIRFFSISASLSNYQPFTWIDAAIRQRRQHLFTIDFSYIISLTSLSIILQSVELLTLLGSQCSK